MIYFTSDWHLDHERIIKYCNRPFKYVEEMNDTLVKNYNHIITMEDTIYFLGDFCLSKRYIEFITLLKGTMVFLWGNHDKNSLFRTFPREIRLTHSGYDIHMTHFPADSQPADLRLVGHVHEKWKIRFDVIDETPLINVGVDQWNFKPVSLVELIRFQKRWVRSEVNSESRKENT